MKNEEYKRTIQFNSYACVKRCLNLRLFFFMYEIRRTNKSKFSVSLFFNRQIGKESPTYVKDG